MRTFRYMANKKRKSRNFFSPLAIHTVIAHCDCTLNLAICRKDNKFLHKSFSQILAFSKIFYIFVMAYGFCRWAVHILLDIFWRFFRTQKLGGFNHTKVGNKMSAFGVYPHHRLARCMWYIIRRGLSVLLIRFTGSQDLGMG